MNNSQVAQAWAEKSKTEARGSHFYFIGDTIYSYGPHFPIARHHEGVVLFTTRSYGNSTAKHKNKTWQACYKTGLKMFHMCDANRNPSMDDVRDKAESIKGCIAAVGRARDKQWKLEALRQQIQDANAFCEHFGFSTRFDIPKELADLVALAEKCKVFLGGDAGAYKMAKEMMAVA